MQLHDDDRVVSLPVNGDAVIVVVDEEIIYGVLQAYL